MIYPSDRYHWAKHRNFTYFLEWKFCAQAVSAEFEQIARNTSEIVLFHNIFAPGN